MEAFLMYLFKSGILLSIFYWVYYLLLRKDTFFTIHRHFLLAGALTSLLLPFLEFTSIKFIEYPNFYSIETNVTASSKIISESINWRLVASMMYIAGILFFLSRFAFQLASLKKLLSGCPSKTTGKFRLLEVSEDIAPFSFFNTIVYNPMLHSEEELDMILKHEKTHARQYHTLDILAINLFTIFQWANPFVWFYKKYLEQNLEFIADRDAVNQVSCKKEYQLTLVRVSSNNYTTITNNFYQSLIKKRIVMLNKQTSQSKKLWKLTVILPLLSLFLWSFNTKEIIKIKPAENPDTSNSNNVFQPKKSKKIIQFMISKKTSEEDFDKIKKTLKTEYDVDIKFTNIERNDADEITGIEVKILSKKSKANYAIKDDTPIQPFVISYNCKIDKINIGQSTNHNDFVWVSKKGGNKGKVVKIHSGDDNKHEFIFGTGDKKMKIRKIKKKDKDGQVIIKEVHGDSDKDFEIYTDDDKTFAFITGNDGKEPIFFIDGKESTKEKMEKLDSDQIESINVLKGKSAIKKYGKEAEDGVIEITTKKN